MREYTEKVKPPRSIFLKWPFGHPLGEPFHVLQQRAVLIEAFTALYTIQKPGTIYDVPFRWKREDYKERKNLMPQLLSRIDSEKDVAAEEKEGDYVMNAIKSAERAGIRPLLWGMAGGTGLLGVYFLILTVAESFSHAVEQFVDMWPWISTLVVGFGIQAGLYSYIRHEIRQRKNAAAATSSMAAAGGISTTSMVACCAHHITDVLPILGVSAAVVFLNQFQNLFLTIGVVSNLIGITLMLRIIQKHHLFRDDQGFLPGLMKVDMSRSLYVVSVFSAFIVLVTLYRSI